LPRVDRCSTLRVELGGGEGSPKAVGLRKDRPLCLPAASILFKSAKGGEGHQTYGWCRLPRQEKGSPWEGKNKLLPRPAGRACVSEWSPEEKPRVLSKNSRAVPTLSTAESTEKVPSLSDKRKKNTSKNSLTSAGSAVRKRMKTRGVELLGGTVEKKKKLTSARTSFPDTLWRFGNKEMNEKKGESWKVGHQPECSG